MLPRAQRLSSAQFDRAFAQSQVVRHPLVQVRGHLRRDELKATRAAFVVPKKQGKAHDRNRTRRRLSERFRLHPRRDDAPLHGCDLVFLSTPATHSATSAELDAALDEVLRRLGKKLGGAGAGLTSSSNPAPGRLMGGAGAGLTSSSNPPSQMAPSGLEEDVSPAPAKPVQFQTRPVAWVLLALIRFYQRFVSPSLPPSCRFFPTCSAYTGEAIERHGALAGTLLGAWRICRCTPLCKGGFDPVPERLDWRPSHFLRLGRKAGAADAKG